MAGNIGLSTQLLLISIANPDMTVMTLGFGGCGTWFLLFDPQVALYES